MTTFNVANTTAGQSDLLIGQTFAPSVPGPNGSGAPPTGASTVFLISITLSFPSDAVRQAAEVCSVYASPPGENDAPITESDGHTDGSEFGTGSFTRTYQFPSTAGLSTTGTYYLWLDEGRFLRYDDTQVYSAGPMYDQYGDAMTGTLQFRVTMGSMPS